MGYEEAALLTLYRRHSERCPVHKLKLTPAAKRKYMDCDCPLWIYGNTETTHVPRQSTGTNIFAVAQAQRQTLLKDGQDQKVHGPRLDDCIERFSASRKEELLRGHLQTGHRGSLWIRPTESRGKHQFAPPAAIAR